MSNYHIYLIGARTPIMPVVLRDLPPVRQCIKSNPSKYHDEHSYPDKYQPVKTPSSTCQQPAGATSFLSIRRGRTRSAPWHGWNTGLRRAASRWNVLTLAAWTFRLIPIGRIGQRARALGLNIWHIVATRTRWQATRPGIIVFAFVQHIIICYARLWCSLRSWLKPNFFHKKSPTSLPKVKIELLFASIPCA